MDWISGNPAAYLKEDFNLLLSGVQVLPIWIHISPSGLMLEFQMQPRTSQEASGCCWYSFLRKVCLSWLLISTILVSAVFIPFTPSSPFFSVTHLPFSIPSFSYPFLFNFFLLLIAAMTLSCYSWDFLFAFAIPKFHCILCLGVYFCAVLFCFFKILLVIYSASWVWEFVCYINSGKLLDIISLHIVSLSLSLLALSRILIVCVIIPLFLSFMLLNLSKIFSLIYLFFISVAVCSFSQIWIPVL